MEQIQNSCSATGWNDLTAPPEQAPHLEHSALMSETGRTALPVGQCHASHGGHCGLLIGGSLSVRVLISVAVSDELFRVSNRRTTSPGIGTSLR